MKITKGYADGPFGQLHYQTCGDGVPVVMIHQSPDSMVQFAPVMRPLADAGAAVIIDESMLSADVLAGQLSEWLSSREVLLTKAEKARSLSTPNALRRITELCLEQAGVRT